MNGTFRRCLSIALGLFLSALAQIAPGAETTPAAAAATSASGGRVSVAFVGDLMLAETPGREIARGRDPFAPFASLIDSADIRVGNLECVVATIGKPDPKKIYSFRTHPRALKLLQRHFDALALANNHSGDFGPEAFAQMLGLLERHQLGWFGGGSDLASAHAPLIVERNGLRIAFLSYNEYFPRSFEADVDRPGIAWSEDEQVKFDIAAARRQADLVIPFMHWGWENERLANPRQRQLARLMIDAGADAVVGGHPHVTQDIEHYRGKPIIYSLGNFVFDGYDNEANNTGWLFRLQLDRAGVVGWQIFVARIDRRGTPHPAPAEEGLCWQRGDATPRAGALSCSDAM